MSRRRKQNRIFFTHVSVRKVYEMKKFCIVTFIVFFIAFAFKCKAQDFTRTQVDPEITETIDYEKLREMFFDQQKGR